MNRTGMGTAFAAVVMSCLGLAACDGSGSPYFPLEEGHGWRYRMEIVPTFEVPEHMKSVRVNLAAVTVDGAEVVPRRHANGVLYYYAAVADGVMRVGIQGASGSGLRRERAPHYVLRYPLRPGMGWRTPSSTYLLLRRYPMDTDYRATVPFFLDHEVESVDETVRVAAGVFRGCLKIRGRGTTSFTGARGVGGIEVEIEAVDWYAPGVGLVKSERREATSSDLFGVTRFSAELESYTTPSWF